MRLAYTTSFNAHDLHSWSGTPYYMASAFEKTCTVEYMGSLKRQLPAFFKLKQIWKKWASHQRESPRFNRVVAKQYSAQIAKKLATTSVDVVLSPLINPIAYLDCKQPIVLWTDAVYAALVGFYPAFAYHSAESIQQGNEITAACLSRCSLAIFSSDWAARTAMEFYGTDRNKVKVVPFGANIDSHPSHDDIKTIIKKRSREIIRLLFLAKSWERKGGDIVLAVAKALHDAGHAVELSIVGYSPELSVIPPYVKCLGFISKQTLEGKARLQQLLRDAHFLFVPSRADACPMVFAEANAFGLPCLTTYVGGISTAVKDHVNGLTFALDAPLSKYCEEIVALSDDRTRYETLALSAYNEYETRLNWTVAVRKVKQLIETFC